MRDFLAIVLSFLAAITAAAVMWLWWRSPIPTFRVFTPLLHGMLLGVALYYVWRALGVAHGERRLMTAALVGFASVIALLFAQYVTDAYAYRDQARRAMRALPVPIVMAGDASTGLSRVLTEYDDNVLSATGKTGMRGYARLQDRRSRWRGLLRFGEALIVIIAASVISAPRPPPASAEGATVTQRPRFSLPRPLVYLWVLPTTAVGLLFVPAALVSGGGMRIVQGVLEVHGGLVAAFLRYCTPLRGGASAMTLGHVVIGRTKELLDFTRSHERVHVRQAERWGPLFIPAYLFLSVLVYLRGGRAYEDNPFEREAYALDRDAMGP